MVQNWHTPYSRANQRRELGRTTERERRREGEGGGGEKAFCMCCDGRVGRVGRVFVFGESLRSPPQEVRGAFPQTYLNHLPDGLQLLSQTAYV